MTNLVVCLQLLQNLKKAGNLTKEQLEVIDKASQLLEEELLKEVQSRTNMQSILTDVIKILLEINHWEISWRDFFDLF